MQLIRPVKTRFPCGSAPLKLNLATYHNSLARSTKSTWSDVLIVLPLLVSIGFQVLFHSPPGVLFTFPSRYYFAIGHQGIFRLGRWSSRLPTGFLVPRGTLVLSVLAHVSPTRLLRPLAALSNAIRLHSLDHVRQSATPDVRRLPVWPLPISLAATLRIAFAFFSSGYLDVSVHRVPPIYLWIQYMVTPHYRRRVPSFGNLRFYVCLQLPAAYRSLTRPSSVLDAKAFALCSF